MGCRRCLTNLGKLSGFSSMISLLCFGSFQSALGFQPPDLAIESMCGQTIDLEKSYLPAVSNWSALPVDGSACTIGFRSCSSCHENSDTRVQLSILSLDFPGVHAPCDNHSRVDVVDADGKTIISDQHGLCGQTDSQTSFTCVTNLLYLRVTSRNQSLHGKLMVLVTSYNTLVCDTDKEFSCDNHRCVDSSLTCNGYNDCGDDSDERDGCWMSTEVVALVAVGGSLVLVVLVLISAFAFKRRLSWGIGTGLAASGRFVINNCENEKRPIKQKRHKEAPHYETLTN